MPLPGRLFHHPLHRTGVASRGGPGRLPEHVLPIPPRSRSDVYRLRHPAMSWPACGRVPPSGEADGDSQARDRNAVPRWPLFGTPRLASCVPKCQDATQCRVTASFFLSFRAWAPEPVRRHPCRRHSQRLSATEGRAVDRTAHRQRTAEAETAPGVLMPKPKRRDGHSVNAFDNAQVTLRRTAQDS